jgi:hypothetical protein
MSVIVIHCASHEINGNKAYCSSVNCCIRMVVRWKVWPLGWLENIQGVFPRNNLTVLESRKTLRDCYNPVDPLEIPFPQIRA